MGYDLILLLLASIYMEKKILKEKYILFSPFFMFHISFLYIYIMPLLLYGNQESQNYLNRLSEEYVNELLLYCRIFYYIFIILEIISCYRIKKKYKFTRFDFKLNSYFFIKIYITLLSGGLLIDLYRVGFNPMSYIYMMISPRDFTYLREGLGPFTILSTFIRLLLIYISLLYFFRKKTWRRLFYLLFAGVFCVLGGSKSSLLFIVIFGILLYQKSAEDMIKISTCSIIKWCFLFVSVLLASFYIMSGSIQLLSFSDVVSFVVSYSQEAFYSALVINDFEFDTEHIWLFLKSVILTPIPRAIYADKEFYSFYNVYWHDLYQPNSPIFHTSTYGFLAEGQMLLGIFCPFIYPVLIIVILNNIYKTFIIGNGFAGLFITSYLISRIYFFTRTSFFDVTSIWTLIVYYLFTRLLINIVNSKISK